MLEKIIDKLANLYFNVPKGRKGYLELKKVCKKCGMVFDFEVRFKKCRNCKGKLEEKFVEV